MTAKSIVAPDLDDIQSGALEPRPVPYARTNYILRINDRHLGRKLLQRLIPFLDIVASFDPNSPVSLAMAQLSGTQISRDAGGVAEYFPTPVPAGYGRTCG